MKPDSGLHTQNEASLPTEDSVPGLHVPAVRLNPRAQAFEFVAQPGKITVVLGGNRSGKTDLCRLVAGLPCLAQGRIFVAGEEITEVDTRRRSVAYVYQEFINYPNATVAENIASPLRSRGDLGERQTLDSVVQDYADRVGLGHLLQRFPEELSGGQQQRLALARALAKEADVLLLDEPLVNLDFKLREALRSELRQMLINSQTTVIYTSSDPQDALAMADALVLLKDGEFLQAGEPFEVYQGPVNLDAMALLCDPQLNVINRDGETWGIRPEHVQLRIPNEFSGDRFSMQVLAVETSGSESFVHGSVRNQEWVARVTGMVQVAVGDQVDVFVSDRDKVVFR